jgi:hypothetical protein
MLFVGTTDPWAELTPQEKPRVERTMWVLAVVLVLVPLAATAVAWLATSDNHTRWAVVFSTGFTFWGAAALAAAYARRLGREG